MFRGISTFNLVTVRHFQRKLQTSQPQTMERYMTAVCGNECTGKVANITGDNTLKFEEDRVDYSIKRIHSDPAAPVESITSSQPERSSSTIQYFSIGSLKQGTMPWPAPSRYLPKGRKLRQVN